MKNNKYVYSFNEGSKDMRSLLGGKGANLAEMTGIGLSVPFGFTVSTEACTCYYRDDKHISDEIMTEIFNALSELEKVVGKKLGDAADPLLVSVRSGAAVSMPGMMDTILNLGLNDDTVEGMAELTGDPGFAYDSYRRFIQMFGDVVLGIPKSRFDAVRDRIIAEQGCTYDTELTAESLMRLTGEYKKIIREETGKTFPQEPEEQLLDAVMAVFRSWNNERAVLYRKMNSIPDDIGTAVNIQSMVFGNMGETSGTGVAFTRNPSNGEKKLFGEFLVNAQGEDVVAGIRTPEPIAKMKDRFGEVYEQFSRTAELLEQHYGDMQDMEFTVEKGRLFLLQTRNGKRTAPAAVKIAVDMESEGLIDRKTAVSRISPEMVDQLLHPRFDTQELETAEKMTSGLPASPGAASGQIYFSAADAVKASERGEAVILVRMETSPEDLAGMAAAEGIMTARGGMTSHAAVVARGMGKCCVSGCSSITVYEDEKRLDIGDIILSEGDRISLDGSAGIVYRGEISSVPPEMSGEFDTIMKWADEIRSLGVRANADEPADAKQAVDFGAEGIGLCRTEHMFFDNERIPAVRRMILADSEEERRAALAVLLPYQKQDFRDMYAVLGERPVTIRLLDPPLHEFLPHNESEIRELSEKISVPYEKLARKTEELHEINPMMGHRGCRLAITWPEIAEMQTEAIISAAAEVRKEYGHDIVPEIMIPLIGTGEELRYVKSIVDRTAEAAMSREEIEFRYHVGTMIEIPRATLEADKIAEDAEFFSFGTNDLTQLTYGFSRDDAGKIIREYVEKGILQADPFQTIDRHGVGRLMETGISLARSVRPDIQLGICGEHGGEPRSIEFCHELGLDYVSCSPYRVPAARLAAAHAALKVSPVV